LGALSFCWNLRGGRLARGPLQRRMITSAGAAGLLGLVLECGQFFLPGRVPSATDVFCFALGGAIGAWPPCRRERANRKDLHHRGRQRRQRLGGGDGRSSPGADLPLRHRRGSGHRQGDGHQPRLALFPLRLARHRLQRPGRPQRRRRGGLGRRGPPPGRHDPQGPAGREPPGPSAGRRADHGPLPAGEGADGHQPGGHPDRALPGPLGGDEHLRPGLLAGHPAVSLLPGRGRPGLGRFRQRVGDRLARRQHDSADPARDDRRRGREASADGTAGRAGRGPDKSPRPSSATPRASTPSASAAGGTTATTRRPWPCPAWSGPRASRRSSRSIWTPASGPPWTSAPRGSPRPWPRLLSPSPPLQAPRGNTAPASCRRP